MEFGVFDLVERNGTPLHAFYRARLRLVEAYERHGFTGYHVAEHHATPHGLTPSPSVFLAAVADRTERLRFGPLVYCLPFYHPLRLLEEICMLDHLSGVGVGRGISSVERGYYGIANVSNERLFLETLAILRSGLTHPVLEHSGEFFRFAGVPIEIPPLQQPPPLWYGLHLPESAAWAAGMGMNVVCGAGTATARTAAARFDEAWAATGATGPRPKVGLVRKIVVAETDAAALAIARAAYPLWLDNFNYLFRRVGVTPKNGDRPPSWDAAAADGLAIAGAPATVVAALREQLTGTTFDYVVGEFVFGDLATDAAERSIALFGAHVIPALREPASV